MDFQGLLERYKPFLLKHWLPLSLGALGMIFFAYGLIGLFVGSRADSEEIVFESSAEQNPVKKKTIFVDIEGAVVKPGLYKLPQESRIQDGLVAAGGLSDSADRDYIAKNINLATKLTDGAKVYVPKKGEAESIKSITGIKGSSQTLVNQININSALEAELDSLPGVGPVTAQKIIAGRPYASVNELLSRKIVGAKVFNEVKEKIGIY